MEIPKQVAKGEPYTNKNPSLLIATLNNKVKEEYDKLNKELCEGKAGSHFKALEFGELLLQKHCNTNVISSSIFTYK